MAYSLYMGPGETESDGGQLTLDVQVVAGLSSLSDGDALCPRRCKRPTGRRWEERTTETAAVMLQSPNLIGLLVLSATLVLLSREPIRRDCSTSLSI